MKSTDAAYLINEIRDCEKFTPNDWEDQFLNSVENMINDGAEITRQQSNKIEEIYRKAYKNL